MTAIPHRILELATRERLGEPVRAYDPAPVRRRAIVWLIILGVPGIVLLPVTIRFLAEGIGWASGLGLLLTLGYLGGAVNVLRGDILPGFGRIVFLFEHGFVHMTRNDAEAYGWDRIETLRMAGMQRGPQSRTRWRFIVVRDDGHELSLGNEIPDVQQLGEILATEVTERVLPKYTARVDNGDSVELGPFTVSRDGVTKDGETIPWPDVREVGLSNGVVYVLRTGGTGDLTRVAATAGEVPNVVAFTLLAEHFKGVTRPSTQ